MQPQITGHSGCSVEVIRENGELRVCKLSHECSYFERLQAQADKQERFLKINTCSDITAPAIIRRVRESECSGMLMEFIHARTYIDYFENASCIAPKLFAGKIIGFLESEFAASPMQEVSADVMISKMESVKKHIAASPLLAEDTEISGLLKNAETFFKRSVQRLWPVGRCHGDLTFSNILFQEDRIYLIDFLDSFIETPLMDLVKLRQDSRYGWSELLYQGAFDRVKNRIVLAYIDDLLWRHFRSFLGVEAGYMELQVMNFLRILQYAHEPRIIAFLKKHLDELLNESSGI